MSTGQTAQATRRLPMRRFYVVTAFGQLGELRLYCKSLRERGLRVLVLANGDSAPCYVDRADRVVVCTDSYSQGSLVEALGDHSREILQFANIPDDNWPAVIGASLSLGVPFPNSRGQINCRIKPKMRDLLRSLLPLQTHLLSADGLTPSRIESVAGRLGVPFVLKPIWGRGSDYVEIVKDRSVAFKKASEMFVALQADSTLRPLRESGTTWDPRLQLLMEQFAPGREFSFEGFIQSGVVVRLMIQEKFRRAQADGFHFETGNLCPTPLLNADEHAHINRMVQDVVNTLGLDNTFFHLEFKWDGERFHVVEVNPRIGGGSVEKMLRFWFDIDIKEMALKLQLGELLPHHYSGRDGFLTGVFVSASRSGVFRSFSGLEWVRNQPEFCFETTYLLPRQFVPSSTSSKCNRVKWMYCYDAFYCCQDVSRADYLHDETLKRVGLEFEDGY